MAKFISAWTSQPIYINPANVQSVMQHQVMFNGQWFWVAGHSLITFSGCGPEDQPTEIVIGSPGEVAELLEATAAWVAGGGKYGTT